MHLLTHAVIRIGFTLSQTQSVQEGNSIDVCVTILEPKEVEIEIKLSVLVQGNASEGMTGQY